MEGDNLRSTPEDLGVELNETVGMMYKKRQISSSMY